MVAAAGLRHRTGAGVGALTTRIALQAIAQAQATATAALTTQQSYEAAVLCSVTVAAAFQVYPGARIGPRCPAREVRRAVVASACGRRAQKEVKAWASS